MTMPSLTDHRPVSICFSDTLLPDHRLSEDEVSNAIARTAKCGAALAISCRRKRYSAGSYFACHRTIPRSEIVRTYVEQEHVFPDAQIAHAFLDAVQRSPVRSRYILFTPEITDDADAITLIVRAEQVSRILGLSGYLNRFAVDVIPAAPTCAAIYRPLIEPDRIHVNFIDYFDREIQAKGFYDPGELLVSMTPALYRELLDAAERSAHGRFAPQNIPTYRAEPLRIMKSTVESR
ncbi:MAG: DUF169 domain-containing protein [Candidatus Peribacteraceae bacterium]|nr:DUF169 domain-containing protein [Candidatus Peribacteraceae bacterium]